MLKTLTEALKVAGWRWIILDRLRKKNWLFDQSELWYFLSFGDTCCSDLSCHGDYALVNTDKAHQSSDTTVAYISKKWGKELWPNIHDSLQNLRVLSFKQSQVFNFNVLIFYFTSMNRQNDSSWQKQPCVSRSLQCMKFSKILDDSNPQLHSLRHHLWGNTRPGANHCSLAGEVRQDTVISVSYIK